MLQSGKYSFYLFTGFMNFVCHRKLRSTVAGKMVINIAVALLIHHVTLAPYSVASLNSALSQTLYTANICSVYTGLYAYFATVLMFLFAAEAVNMFVIIVLIFSEIDHYVTKATAIAWSKK